MPRESRSGGDAACFSLNYLPSVSLRRVKPWSYAPRGNSPAVLRLTVSCPDGRAAPAPDLKRSGQGGPRACAAAVHRGPPSNEKPRVGARGCSARRHGGVWGAAPRFLSGTISSDTPAAYYTLVCVFRLAGGLLLLRHTAGRLTNVGNQAESKPFTSCIRGWGRSEYWIGGQRCGPR